LGFFLVFFPAWDRLQYSTYPSLSSTDYSSFILNRLGAWSLLGTGFCQLIAYFGLKIPRLGYRMSLLGILYGIFGGLLFVIGTPRLIQVVGQNSDFGGTYFVQLYTTLVFLILSVVFALTSPRLFKAALLGRESG